jgi:2-keto-3-deoxy-6-phosphogluconate aldolase
MNDPHIVDIYRTVHEQVFLPIFVQDALDSKTLVEACVRAGCKCIEYTLRRADADEMIPWILQNYPDLYVLVGSTIDDEKIVKKLKEKHKQLLTIAELDKMGVHGFVSMMGWILESIHKYSSRRIIIPAAMTMTEALQQTGVGAHFIKILGTDLDFAKRCRAAPTFDFCPIMITGGMNLERMKDGFAAGAMIIGSGFDLILKDQPNDISCSGISAKLKAYIDAAKAARNQIFPQLANTQNLPTDQWLKILPHYHCF